MNQPDPCHAVDPNVQDLIDLRVWCPDDTIEFWNMGEYLLSKPDDIVIRWLAPKFAMAFVCDNEDVNIQTFGVN